MLDGGPVPSACVPSMELCRNSPPCLPPSLRTLIPFSLCSSPEFFLDKSLAHYSLAPTMLLGVGLREGGLITTLFPERKLQLRGDCDSTQGTQ